VPRIQEQLLRSRAAAGELPSRVPLDSFVNVTGERVKPTKEAVPVRLDGIHHITCMTDASRKPERLRPRERRASVEPPLRRAAPLPVGASREEA
jgi:hypothetical protein